MTKAETNALLQQKTLAADSASDFLREAIDKFNVLNDAAVARMRAMTLSTRHGRGTDEQDRR